MTKHDFVRVVAHAGGYTVAEAEKAVSAVTKAVIAVIASGNDVRLPGFGVFVVVDRAERKGRNPQTGEEITIPATKAVVFRAGKELRKAASGNR